MSSELSSSTTASAADPTLRVLEKPAPKRPSPLRMVVMALAIVIAVLGTGVGIYLWQHGQTTNRETLVTRLRAELADRNRQISALYDRVLIHSRQLESATAEIALLKKGGQGMTAGLQNLQAKLDATRKDLAATKRQLDIMVGPALADGGYTGVLYAADDADTPPRIAMFVIDDSKGNVLPDKGWRVIEVTPDVTVRLTTPPGGPATTDFGAFVEMWSHGDPTFAYLHAVGYSITVSDGRVSELVETGEPIWGG